MIFMKNVIAGMTVFHSRRWDWDTGTVLAIRDKDESNLRTAYKVLVEFPKKGIKRWFRPSDIIKGPELKRSKREIKAIGPFIPQK